MPRNSSGVYSLPAAYNPVVTGTTIESLWANTTLSDVAQAITDSLDRNGKGSMLAPFKLFDGTTALPGLAFTNESTSGMSRPTAGQVSFSILAAEKLRIAADAVSAIGGIPLRSYSSDNSKYAGILNDGSRATLSSNSTEFTLSLGGNVMTTVDSAGALSQAGDFISNKETQPALTLNNTDDSSFGSVLFKSSSTTNAQVWGGGANYASFGGASSLNFSAGGVMAFHTNGYTERMRIAVGGEVGIGTKAPSSLLHLYATAPILKFQLGDATLANAIQFLSTTGTLRQQIWAGGSSYPSFGGANSLNVQADGALAFYTGGYDERMRISSGGSVGIGTNSPSYLLHLYGVSSTLRIDGTSGVSALSFGTDGGDSAITRSGKTLYYDNAIDTGLVHLFRANGNNLMWVDEAGNFTAAGNVTASSDERLKEDWQGLHSSFLSDLAEVKSGTFYRPDLKVRQAGVSAQSLREALPEVVLGDEAEGMLSVNYGAAALVACVEIARVLRNEGLL